MCPRDGRGRGSGSGAEATPTRLSGEWSARPPHVRSMRRLFSCQRLCGVMVPEVCGHSGCTPVAVYVRPKRAGVVGGEGVGALPNMRGFDDAVGRMEASVQRCPWGCALSVPDDDVSSYPSRGGGTRSQSAGHGRHDKEGQGSPVCGEDGRPQGTTGADGARKESADQCPPSLTGSSVQGRGGSPHSGVGQGASVRWYLGVRSRSVAGLRGFGGTCGGIRGGRRRVCRGGKAADAKELLTHQTGAQHQVVPVGVDRVPGKPRQHVLARTPPTTASPPPSRRR